MVLIAAPGGEAELADPSSEPIVKVEADHAAGNTPGNATGPKILVMSSTLVEEASAPPTETLSSDEATSTDARSTEAEPTEMALPPRRATPVVGAALAVTTVALTATASLVAYAWLVPDEPPQVASRAAVAPSEVSRPAEVAAPVEAEQLARPPLAEPPLPQVSPTRQEVRKPPVEETPAPTPRAPVAEAPNPNTTNPLPLPATFDPLDYDPESIDLALLPTHAPNALATETDYRSEAQRLVTQRPPVQGNASIMVERLARSETPDHNLPDAATQLAQPIPEIDLQAVPLVEVVELIGDLSGVPVSLAPAALQQAGIDARREIDLQGVGVPLGEILRKSLATVRLDWQAVGPHLLITRPHVEQARTVTHDLRDLVQNDQAQFAAMLTRVGPPELAHAETRWDSGKLTLEASRHVHYDLMLLAERLRLVRHLTLKSKYPKKLLRTQPNLAAMHSRLDRRTTFSFVAPTPLRQIFEHWSHATGLTLLVDWHALSSVDLVPSSPLLTTCTDRPWHEALDGVLTPLSLDWAAVDDQTLWISTAEVIAQTPSLELYPEVDPNQREEFPPHSYDAPSRTVIVRGNHARQRTAFTAWQRLAQPVNKTAALDE